MFILIEDRAEIRQAQSDLEVTIRREFPVTTIRDIGWQGGRQLQGNLLVLVSRRQEQCSPPSTAELVWPYWRRPGRGIAVEVNTSYADRNDSMAGFFARNTVNGRTYLFHSGRVGGGAEGVTTDALVAWSDLELQLIDAKDGSRKEGILVGPVLFRSI